MKLLVEDKMKSYSDEELRDLTGRALGWIDYPTDSIERGEVWHLDAATAPQGRILPKYEWDPLNCSIDALSLAVDLCLHVDPNEEGCMVYLHYDGKCEMFEVNGDPHESTRRAIVLAAAYLGYIKGGVA
jgi:hypothetical protein